MKPTAPALPPRRAPSRIASAAELRAFQRVMFDLVTRPITRGGRLISRPSDGRPLRDIAGELVKPSARSTSLERLEIYGRSYWSRLINCVCESCPALRTLLGERKFEALIAAYLTRYPSRSFALRDLCSRLAEFIVEAPRFTSPHTGLAHAVARFEWAQTLAFDAAARRPLTAREIVAKRLRRSPLGVQPHLSLLALDWPVDEFVAAIEKHPTHRMASSHVVDRPHRTRQPRQPALPPRRRVHLAVHRGDLDIFVKRLDARAFRLLQAISHGGTLEQVLRSGAAGIGEHRLQSLFSEWVALGWLCRRS